MGAPGFDDSPEVDIVPGATGHPFTLVLPYYDNPNFLNWQLTAWSKWPACLRAEVRLIVVDDCSPGTPALEVLRRCSPFPPFATRLFRIEKDVRWGWPAARNIGMHHAEKGWCLLTDMDHVLSHIDALTLMWGDFDPGTIYRPSRIEQGRRIHPHPNSMFMTRALFWRIGGYDERVLGYYGSDSYWRRRCAAGAPVRLMRNIALERREHDGDSSTTGYLRKQPEDAALRPLMRTLPPGAKPLVLTQPYHEEML